MSLGRAHHEGDRWYPYLSLRDSYIERHEGEWRIFVNGKPMGSRRTSEEALTAIRLKIGPKPRGSRAAVKRQP